MRKKEIKIYCLYYSTYVYVRRNILFVFCILYRKPSRERYKDIRVLVLEFSFVFLFFSIEVNLSVEEGSAPPTPATPEGPAEPDNVETNHLQRIRPLDPRALHVKSYGHIIETNQFSLERFAKRGLKPTARATPLRSKKKIFGFFKRYLIYF
jgi:hypothetical protein